VFVVHNTPLEFKIVVGCCTSMHDMPSNQQVYA
jgi:hypothetical protein